MLKRCTWVEGGTDDYVTYHDEEWAVPIHDDRKLFEFIVLESAQAGLSWKTILNKREGYRKLFKQFDPKKVAKMSENDVEALMQNPSIIRNRLKIRATINNAQQFIHIQKEFGSFDHYMWQWVGEKVLQNTWKSGEVPATTPLAVEMAKDLRRRGFTFLGPTIWYAHMQAVGLVNDHTTECFRHTQIARMR